MQREIKFRGKTDSGIWIYGYLIVMPNGDCGIFEIGDIEAGASDVNPKTVGQFTGLHDRNGKEIYEGDILKEWGDFNYYWERHYYVEYLKYTYGSNTYIRWRTKGIDEKGVGELSIHSVYNNDVIGNIHDNQELINNQQ